MKIFFSFILFTPFISGFSQTGVDPWSTLRTINTGYYEFQVPVKWKAWPTDSGGYLFYFQASGQGFPLTYNGSPVTANAYFSEVKCYNRNDCKKTRLEAYHSSHDRVFNPKFPDVIELIHLNNGQEVYMIQTRFYSKSKKRYTSLYELVAWSNAKRGGFSYTLAVEHGDKEYKIEKAITLDTKAKGLFSYLNIK